MTPTICRTCGFANCPGASGGNCPRWPARDEVQVPRPAVFTRWDAEDAEVQAKLAELDRAPQAPSFQTAYDKHTAYFFAELFGPASDGPQKFGPGYVTDVCRCGHERGSHWDGDGSCDPATCGCRIFREQQA